MIQDQWREQNEFGEFNDLPSMTEPIKTYTVYDYLRDPSIVLGQRKPVEASEVGYIDTSDPRRTRVVETTTFDDLEDSWNQDLPRDPALYGAGDAPARTPSSSRAASKKAAQKAPQAKSSSISDGDDGAAPAATPGEQGAASE